MAKYRVTVQPLEDRHQFISINQRLAYITQNLLRAGKGGRKARTISGYIGFNSASEALKFASQLRQQHCGIYAEARPAERLTACTHEVKIRHADVEQIIWNYSQQLETVGTAVERHLKVVASRPSLAPDQPCSRYNRAPVTPRHTGRTTITSRDGLVTVGID